MDFSILVDRKRQIVRYMQPDITIGEIRTSEDRGRYEPEEVQIRI